MNKHEHDASEVKLLVTIMDREHGKAFKKLLEGEPVGIFIYMLGRGTADSNMLDLLLLGQSEKAVVLVPVLAQHASRVLRKIVEGMHLERPGGGIAFTIPIGSVTGRKVLGFLGGRYKEHLLQMQQEGK
ncbi:MAG: hypothetical protein ACOX88_06065 [Christensenellales bacterium]|jgi:hypothetical protein